MIMIRRRRRRRMIIKCVVKDTVNLTRGMVAKSVPLPIA